MRKKICFISADIGHSGGTERVCTLIANELASRGYNVTILSFWKGNPPFFDVDQRVKVDYLIHNRYEAWLKKTYIYAVIKLALYIRKYKLDVVIDVDTFLGKYSTAATYLTKFKLVSWEHFNYLNTLKDPKRAKVLEAVKKRSTKLLVLTKDDKRMHIDMAHFPEGMIEQIYNPTPFIIESTYESSERIFLAVGRLTYQKGFDRLLDIWKTVEEELPQWKLVIVGSGEEKKSLEEKINKLKLYNIEICPVTNSITTFYERASIYVMTSRYEGYPMVLLEAKSKGVPIISYDCKTGPSELVTDGVSGFLVDDGDCNTFAKRMIQLAKEKELRHSFSNRCLQEIQECTVKKIGDQWECLLENI